MWISKDTDLQYLKTYTDPTCYVEYESAVSRGPLHIPHGGRIAFLFTGRDPP